MQILGFADSTLAVKRSHKNNWAVKELSIVSKPVPNLLVKLIALHKGLILKCTNSLMKLILWTIIVLST